MRPYTVKIFFNDGGHLLVDCDDFIICDNSHYVAIKDEFRIMTIPFGSVKYTVLVVNEN